MSFFTHSSIYVGIERTSNGLRIATLLKKSKGWEIAHLKKILWEENVNPLDKLPKDAIISTAISSKEVIVRSLEIPLKKEKDIQAALPFQAEPLLPYPVEKCILQKTNLECLPSSTTLTVFSIKKEALQSHLEHYRTLTIDPDVVTCAPQALAAFSTLGGFGADPFLVLHLGDKEGTLALVEKGKVLSARPLVKDLNDIHKNLLAIASSLKSKKIESILYLGEDLSFVEKIESLSDQKIIHLKIPTISDENLQKFGFAIGVAMAGGWEEGCNFRQNEFAYAKPWKKIKKPFFTFCTAVTLLFASIFGLTQFLLTKEETRIQKEYLALLAQLGKKEENGLSNEKMHSALSQLEEEIKARPDTFPLLPLVPKVSDLLAWLSSQPSFHPHEDPSFGVDSFHYVLEKRPDFTHRTERYLVKVELEFTASVPTVARAFYDALLSPNPFVDNKKEIQWTPGKNKYYVSFYLKDKTRYN